MKAICARMRFFSVVAVFVFCISVRVSNASFVNGQNYIPIAGWARANGLRIVSMTQNEIVVTNKTARLVFETDSADAKINGVNVRLSFPVAKDGEISQLDIDTAVRPLILSPKISTKRITTICIDPGHGGKDTGNHVGNRFWGYNEKTYTLALAEELRDQLKRAGFNVILTRSRDTFVELPQRPAVANRAGADLFISLHFNATESGKNDVWGPETYCITPVGAASSNAQGEGANYGATIANRIQDKSLLLAYQMQKSLVQNLRVPDRDVRRARFAVLRDALMPAILIEGGYMTHPVEGKKIFTSDYRKQMASAIVKGVLNYQRLAAPAVPAAPIMKTTSVPATSRKVSPSQKSK